MGNWTEIVQPLPTPEAFAVAAADVNLDGNLDLAAGTKDGLLVLAGRRQLLLGDHDPGFADRRHLERRGWGQIGRHGVL